MASTFESPPIAPSRESQLIERQLDVTRWNVRLVELGAAAVAWVASVLLYLLVVAVVDHWLMPLGTAGRFLALALLIGGTAAFFALILWPLLRREINPVYAARTIEESVPSLKNSLVNFLLLRKDPNGLKAAVLSAVEQRAAVDISNVPVDLAVDRSKVIRLGYVLLAIVSVFALYKVRSPKDPFQTMARVFAPWANIERPARVTINEIEPGDTKVYHGQSVTVRCVVLGLRTNETVKVVYSSLDGQTMEKTVPLQPSAIGTRFEAEIPARDSAERGPLGVQQDLVYRIVAGDYVSRDYQVKVTTAPTMVVERVTYDFKPYTRKSQLVVAGQGDLQALEGTRVTIHARANQPIETGFLELDPAVDGRTAAGERIPLIVDGSEARAALTLQLKPDRQTPWRTSYQLRFVTKGGERNDQAIVHRIDVTPDLAPEIEWLTPEKARVDVPLDGKQLLELRGVDPDFGLKAIKLTATRGDLKLFEKPLLATLNPLPQATVRFEFKPAELSLDEGDEIVVWGTAEDGRVAPLSDAADPNRTKSSHVTLKITAPTEKPANNAANPNSNAKPNDPQQPPRIQPQPKPGEKTEPKENPKNDPNKDPMKDEKTSQNAGKKEEGGNKSETPMKGEEGDSSEQNGGKGSQAGGSGGNQQESKEGEGGSQSASKSQGSKGGKESGNESSADSGDEGDDAGDASGAGKKGGKPGQPGKEQQGGGDPGDSENSPGGSNSTGSSGEGSENSKPHDGEVFDKVLEQLKKEGKQPKAGNQGKPAGERPAGDQSGEGGKSDDEGGKNSPQQQAGGKNAKPGEKTPGTKEPAGGEKKEGEAGDSSKPGDDANGNKSEGGNPKDNSNNGNSPDKGGKPKGSKPGDPRPGDRPAEGAPDKVDPNQPGKKPGLEDKNLGQGGAQKPAPGEGGAPQKNPPNPKEGPQPGESGSDQGKPKDPGAGDTGTPGAGANSKNPMGSGPSDQANRDKPKTLSPDGPQPESGEPSPPGQGKKQSDSKGGESGDRNGGGKQGGGQPGKQEGNDSPGSKSAADQGAGKANDPGKGETGTKGGGQEKTDQKTGTSGNEPGNGSQSKEKSEGQGKEGKSDEPGEGSATDKKPNSENGGQGTGQGKKGDVVAGGAQGTGEGDRSRPDGVVPDGDAANLKYAEQATDLVIDHLKDQEHNPDPALLKQLGWTKDDLSAFLRRWENLKQGAEKPDAKRQLEESLRSLGLKAPKDSKRTGGNTADKVRDLQDAGGRSTPPSRYRDQFEAFRKGVGRSSDGK